MTPSILIQLFRKTGAWLTLRGWAMVGGFAAAGAILGTLVFHWN